MRRRRFILASVAAAAAPLARAQGVAPAQDIRPIVESITGGASPEASGVEVELAQIAENGNSIPLRVRVPSPMTEAHHVRAVHVIAERNPRPRVATFHFTPASGRAEVSSFIRLNGSQRVVAIAELSDGSFWSDAAFIEVREAACTEDG